MKRSSLRQQVGTLLIVGLEGLQLSAMERAWLKLIGPSGVILFRRNIETAAQTSDLLFQVGEVVGSALFRCVDVEGGLVDRLRDAVAPMPSAAAVAATGKRSLFRKHGALIGREVKVFGFNTTFAPVLDLALPESQSVMRTRTTFAEALRVTEYAKEFLLGLASEGVLGCGKHFPGLGGGTLDSHEATPRIDRTWDEMWRTDLYPYRQLAKKLTLVMVSHAAYPNAGTDSLPASISPFWIQKVLQRRLKYPGLVLSDDMEMGGILSQKSIEEAAVSAVLAGTDLIEICKDPALILRAYEALLREAESSSSFRRMAEAAARKVQTARDKKAAASTRKRPSEKQIDPLRREIAALRTQAPEPLASSSAVSERA